MQKLIEFMNLKKIHFKRWDNIEVKVFDVVAFILFSIFGLYMRSRFFDYASGDFIACLDVWTEKFKQFGFEAIAHDHYNYTPLYMYVLYFISRIPFPRLLAIKLFSILFDFALAITVGLIFIVTHKKNGWNAIPKGIVAYAIILFTPTVIVNSAMWAQCDAIYVTFIMLSLLFLFTGKDKTAMLMYSIAFSLKLQSIFFLPFLLFLAIQGKKIKWHTFCYIPITYFITIIPAWIGGRPLSELLTIYIGQAQVGGRLALAWPNIYYILGYTDFVEYYGSAGVLFVAACLAILFYYILTNVYKKELSDKYLIAIALFSTMIFAFFLPFMHERYAYLVDILSILYVFYNIKRIYVPVVCIMTSYLGYTMYFVKVDFIGTFNIVLVPFFYLAAMLIVGYDIYKDTLKLCERDTN